MEARSKSALGMRKRGCHFGAQHRLDVDCHLPDETYVVEEPCSDVAFVQER